MQFLEEPKLVLETDLCRYYRNNDTISLTRLAKSIVGTAWSVVYVEHRRTGIYEYALIDSRHPDILKFVSRNYAEMAKKLDAYWHKKNTQPESEADGTA